MEKGKKRNGKFLGLSRASIRVISARKNFEQGAFKTSTGGEPSDVTQKKGGKKNLGQA